MIVTHYIYHRNGSLRVVDSVVADPSDPPAVQSFYSARPPFQAVDFQIDAQNELLFNAPQTPVQVGTAFAALDAAIAAAIAAMPPVRPPVNPPVS